MHAIAGRRSRRALPLALALTAATLLCVVGRCCAEPVFEDTIVDGALSVRTLQEEGDEGILVMQHDELPIEGGEFKFLIESCEGELAFNVTAPNGKTFLQRSHPQVATVFASDVAMFGNYTIRLQALANNTKFHVLFVTSQDSWPYPELESLDVSISDHDAHSVRVSWAAATSAISAELLYDVYAFHLEHEENGEHDHGELEERLRSACSVVHLAAESLDLVAAIAKNITGTSYTVTGLEAGSEYVIAVLAKTADGEFASAFAPVLVEATTDGDDEDDGTVWAYALLSVLLVCLCSLSGILLLLMRPGTMKALLLDIIGLSVGTFIGTSWLSLIPEGSEALGGISERAGIVGLVGVVFGYVTEHILRTHAANTDDLEVEMHRIQAPNGTPVDNPRETQEALRDPERENGAEEDSKGTHREPKSAGPPSSNDDRYESSMVWNLIVGDVIHNFVDGALIGVTFLDSLSTGISTTVAVMLHEVPQEIGDFAIMVHAGWSYKKALMINFVTACSAFLGAIFILGLSESEDMEDANSYMLLFVAGLFLYLALAQLIPEILTTHKSNGHSLARKLRVSVMVLVGIALMGMIQLLPLAEHSHGSGDGHVH